MIYTDSSVGNYGKKGALRAFQDVLGPVTAPAFGVFRNKRPQNNKQRTVENEGRGDVCIDVSCIDVSTNVYTI